MTPGTGIPELLAIFSVLLAGYAVYHLSFNWWALALLMSKRRAIHDSIRGPRARGLAGAVHPEPDNRFRLFFLRRKGLIRSIHSWRRTHQFYIRRFCGGCPQGGGGRPVSTRAWALEPHRSERRAEDRRQRGWLRASIRRAEVGPQRRRSLTAGSTVSSWSRMVLF